MLTMARLTHLLGHVTRYCNLITPYCLSIRYWPIGRFMIYKNPTNGSVKKHHDLLKIC